MGSADSTSHQPAFVFAAGGTGGHIYPGIAIARQLLQRSPHAHIRFICSNRPIDARVMNSQPDLAWEVIRAAPISARPTGFATFARSWGPSVRTSTHIIQDATQHTGTSPTIVALGGFVSAPVVRAAKQLRCRVVLVNLDTAPGKANRLLARWADTILDAAGVPTGRVGTRHAQPIPPIVRASVYAPAPKHECTQQLNLDPSKRTLMVTGGSQGARSINELMIELAQHHQSLFDNWQVIHQAGSDDAAQRARAAYTQHSIPALVQPFVDQMGLWWGAADLAICRAGAGTVGEAWANTVPCLFLPYPYHRDQHQRLNAQRLVDASCALCKQDHIDATANAATLTPLLHTLMTPDHLNQMRHACAQLGPADGAQQVANALLAQ